MSKITVGQATGLSPFPPYYFQNSSSSSSVVVPAVQEIYDRSISGAESGAAVSRSPIFSVDRGLDQSFLYLKRHLEGLCNPILLGDILAAVQKDSVMESDPLKGIQRLINSLILPNNIPNLPNDIMGLFISYDQALRREAEKTDSEEGQATLQNLSKQHYKELLEITSEEKHLSTNIKIFFSLRAVKRFNNEAMKVVVSYFDEGEVTKSRDFISDQLKKLEENLHEVNKELTSKGGRDLDTLIGQIIDECSKESEGIETHWNQPCPFFVGKYLRIFESPTLLAHYGTISTAKKGNEEYWEFELENRSLVRVFRDKKIEVTTKTFYSDLFKALETGRIEMREKLTLVSEKTRDFLSSGDYLIIAVETIPGGDTVVELKPENNRSIYHLIKKSVKRDLIFVESYNIEGRPELSDISKHPGLLIDATAQIGPGNLMPKTQEKSPLQFFSDYKFFRHSTPTSLQVEDLDSQVVITKLEGSHQGNFGPYRVAEERFESIREELSKNQPLLNGLTDLLIQAQLREIEVDEVGKMTGGTRLLQKVLELCEFYRLSLQIEKQPSDLLKAVVEEANYVQLILKKASHLVFKTMKTFSLAFESVEKLTGKKLILILGKTGAGKSTVSSALLGAPLEPFENQVTKERHFRIDASKTSKGPYPSIGHQLGESETVYPTAKPWKALSASNALASTPPSRLKVVPMAMEMTGLRDKNLARDV